MTQHIDIEARTANSGFKKLAVQWLNQVQFSNQTFVVADSLVLRNRQLLKPANRYWPFKKTIVQKLITNLLFIILTFLAACEPQVTFDEPQPVDTENLKKFPSTMQGEYVSLGDNSILLIQDQTIQRIYDIDFKGLIDSLDNNFKISGDTIFDLETDEKYHIKRVGDTIIYNVYYVDTLFQINQDNIVRKLNGYYFINQSYNQDSWEVKKIQLSKGQLIISRVSAKLEIENLKNLTEAPQDTEPPYKISATKKQFKKFVRDEGFKDSEVFVRRKKTANNRPLPQAWRF